MPAPPPDQPLLKTQNLHRILGVGDTALPILRGIDLVIPPRSYTAIVGPSGSGKSTLLYLLGGLDRPSRLDVAGRPYQPGSAVYIEGRDTADLDDNALAVLRNREIGFVFQFHYLLKDFTVQENVALPILKLGRVSRSLAVARADALLTRLGLQDKAQRRTTRLSGGEQQRVAIARALANQPAVLLADEPTGNLDSHNSQIIAEIFDELAAEGQSIVMVTHDLVFARRAHRIIRLEDGQVVSDRLHEHAVRAADKK